LEVGIEADYNSGYRFCFNKYMNIDKLYEQYDYYLFYKNNLAKWELQ